METNYYILLELDPSVRDINIIKSTAKAKISEWNKAVNNPKKKFLVADKVALYNKIIKDIEGNPECLKEHAAAYRTIKEKQKQEAEKAIREAAKVLIINGEIHESDLKILTKEHTQYTENEILKILGAKIKQKKVFKYTDDGIKELLPSVFKDISKNLEVIGKKDLYDFLGLKRTSSSKELEAKRADIYAINSKNANKDNIVTATGALCGICQSIFNDEEKRKNYNKTLDNLVFVDIKAKIDSATRTIKIINPDQYKILLSDCAAKGISKEKAEYYIYSHCETKQVTIIEPSDSNFLNMVSCRICATSNVPEATVCKSCAFPLIVICPKCSKQSADPTELKCSNCGFSIGDMPNAELMILQANASLAVKDIKAANNYLVQAETYWPTYPKTAELKSKIQKELDNIAANIRKAEEYKKNKEYISLRTFLNNIRIDNPQLSIYKAEAENAIASATAILSKARTTTDMVAKLDIYMQVLNICSDLEDAKKELKINPPQPPKGLKVATIGKTIRLTWDRLSSTFINYSIVRKANGTPQNPKDGEVVAVLSDNKFDDVNTTPGLSYYYAVYSKCADIYSKNAAVEGPMLTMAEINNSSLKYDIQEKHINFSCKFPQNAKAVEVYRDKVLVKTLTSENFLDSNLVAEKQYTYRFVAIYEDCLGRKFQTKGIEVQLKPTAPPKAVELKVASTDTNATLSWTNPAKGVLEIYHSDKPFSENKNDLVNTDSFKGEKILVSGTSRVINKDFNGVRYYLPLTIAGKIGVAGQQVMIVSILQPKNVNIEKNDERNINVSWEWGNGIDTIKIITQVDGGKEIGNEINRKENLSPQFKVSIPKEAKSIRVGIATVLRTHSRETLLSETIDKLFNLQIAKIDFLEVKKGGFFSKNKYELTVQANAPVNCDLHLLIREDLPPSNLNNYHSYLTIPARDLNTNKPIRYTVEYSKTDKKNSVVFRLIPADKAQRNNIVIIPEVKEVK